jgi:hypothetical protein
MEALKKDSSFRAKRLPNGHEDIRMRLDLVRVVISRRGGQLLLGGKRNGFRVRLAEFHCELGCYPEPHPSYIIL